MTKNDFKIFNLLLLLIILLGIASALGSIKLMPPSPRTPLVVTTPSPVTPSYIPQFVLISFDGAKSNDLWKDLRLFKEEMDGTTTPQKILNFTFFINPSYLLTNENKHLYKGPGKAPGMNTIGFGEDVEHVRTRIGEINTAVADGDEISIHTVGHFSGLGWSAGEWNEELDSFNHVLFDLDSYYPGIKLPSLKVATSSVIGFRAPYLDRSPGLYDALHSRHMRYDSSEVGTGNSWPTKDVQGMWHIPLGTLHIGPEKRSVLAMDYNLYFYHSQAQNLLKRGTPEWQTAYKETLAGFEDYFNKNYSGNRAPVLVGYHFSRDWNDGVYWDVMKTFAREECIKPQVKCGTFRNLVDYLDKNGVPTTTPKIQTASAADAEMGQNMDVATGREDGEGI